LSESHHFVVSQKDTAWQFSFRGEVTGPFSDRNQAIESAIAEATATGLPDVEVVVQDPDTKTEVVWRPTADG
jgi:hypothetical protein